MDIPGRQRSESDMAPSDHRDWQFQAYVRIRAHARPTLGPRQLCAIAVGGPLAHYGVATSPAMRERGSARGPTNRSSEPFVAASHLTGARSLPSPGRSQRHGLRRRTTARCTPSGSRTVPFQGVAKAKLLEVNEAALRGMLSRARRAGVISALVHDIACS